MSANKARTLFLPLALILCLILASACPLSWAKAAGGNTPHITSTPIRYQEAVGLYLYQVEADAGGGGFLSYSLSQSPSWLTVTPSGLVYGLALHIPGARSVTVTASNEGGIASQSYSLYAPTPSTSLQFLFDLDSSRPGWQDALSNLPLGSAFTLQLVAEQAEGLFGWNADLVFDPQVLEVVSQKGASAVEGDFLTSYAASQGDQTAFFAGASAPSDPGRLNLADVLLCGTNPKHPGPSGAGSLAQVTFRLLRPGQTTLRVERMAACDRDQQFGYPGWGFAYVSTTTVDRPPRITSDPPIIAEVNAPYLYPIEAVDPEAGSLSYALRVAPAGMTVDTEGLVQWRPSSGQVGTHPVLLFLTDSFGNRVQQGWEIEADPDHTPPDPPSALVAQAVPTSATQGQAVLSWQPSASLDVTGYAIYRTNTGTGFVHTATVGLVSAYQDADIPVVSTYTYRLTAFDDSGLESAPSNEATVYLPPLTKTLTLPLQTGWNQISLPFQLEGASPAEVFAGLPSGWLLVQFDATLAAYQSVSQLRPGTGYWLRITASTGFPVKATPLSTPTLSIPLALGWNLVGSPFLANLTWVELWLEKNSQRELLPQAVALGWIQPVIYRWLGSEYQDAYLGSPQAGAGYWLKALQPCRLIWSSPPGGER